jgi:hypothetical protein
MKKKVSRYQGGGVLRDRFGNPVRSGSGEPVRTRYPESSSRESLVDIEDRSTKSPRLMEEEDSVGPMNYETLGRRASPVSMMGGPKLNIKEETTETEYEPPKAREMPSGVASGFKAKDYLEEIESKGGGPRSETSASKPTVAKKKKKESRMTSAKEALEKGFAGPAESTPKPAKPESALSRIGKAFKGTFEERNRPYQGTFSGRGMKSGGKVSSASSRADGIAQRGKTRGRMC